MKLLARKKCIIVSGGAIPYKPSSMATSDTLKKLVKIKKPMKNKP
ncbi:hypothetical protein [Pseudoalteromonas aurantia]|nr:hypothetical protein [Pseudoalteromonas aurantia]